MIEKYWNEVFGQFKNKDGKFEIPGFPEPLMSAHFGVQNVVGETNNKIKQTFKLCEFAPTLSRNDTPATFEPLFNAISCSAFWSYQNFKNTGAYPFIKRFLPFVVTLPTAHFHFFIRENDRIVASAIVGVGECSVFLFNLSVPEEERKKGLANKLVKQVRGEFPEKPLFFWTLHPWLKLDSKVTEYHLLED